jgi:hypothetical protein
MRFEKSPGGVLMPDKTWVGGRFHGQHIRGGQVIEEFEDDNLVVNQGLNNILDTYFNAAAQQTWYLGLFQGNYTPVATETAATVAASSTENAGYGGTTRPTFTTVSASGESVTNSASRASYTFTGSYTIYGAFLISNSTISGTAGVLFSAAQFATAKSVANTDQLLLTYTFTASSV